MNKKNISQNKKTKIPRKKKSKSCKFIRKNSKKKRKKRKNKKKGKPPTPGRITFTEAAAMVNQIENLKCDEAKRRGTRIPGKKP